jgi:hypothetical protein
MVKEHVLWTRDTDILFIKVIEIFQIAWSNDVFFKE